MCNKAEIETDCKLGATVEGKCLKADLNSGGMSSDERIEEVGYALIEYAYRRSDRAIGPDLAT